MDRIGYLRLSGVILVTCGATVAVVLAMIGGNAADMNARGLLFVYPALITGLVLLVWSRVEGALESMAGVERSINALVTSVATLQEDVVDLSGDLDAYLDGDVEE